MATIISSQDLSHAIVFVEDLLNSKDGDQVLKEIRRIKNEKSQNTYPAFQYLPDAIK